MSLEWAAAGYSDQDDNHVGAACALPAIDFEQLEWKRNDLKDITFSCQHVNTIILLIKFKSILIKDLFHRIKLFTLLPLLTSALGSLHTLEDIICVSKLLFVGPEQTTI